MSKRRDARERVLQALYAYEIAEDHVEHLIKTIIKPNLSEDKASYDFAVRLLINTIDHTEEADAFIADHAQNWELGRIAVIDRILIRMAIVEFLYFQDIPPKVSINESIEIAKRFSTARSGKFINGILDSVLDKLRKNDVLRKKGRGLIGFETPRVG